MAITAHKASTEVLLGLALSAAMVLGVALVYISFTGGFSSAYTVKASVSNAGDALEVGDIVTYRDIIVGRVKSTEGQSTGGAAMTLTVGRGYGKVIPATVTAIAVPVSLFGATAIQLNLPKTASAAGPFLHDGVVIAPDTSPGATGLQTALSSAYTLLTAVHPAQLDAALSALATALDGEGANLGRLVDQASTFLAKLAPEMPELATAITNVATVSAELAHNAPDLVKSLANMLVVAKGIDADQPSVNSLLAIAPTVLDNATSLVNALSPNFVASVNDLQPVLAAAAGSAGALAQTVTGFKAFADTFNGVLVGGRAHVTLTITGADISGIVPLILDSNSSANMLKGATTAREAGYVPSYTAADCPRYPGASGRNCGGAAGSTFGELLLGPNSGGTS